MSEMTMEGLRAQHPRITFNDNPKLADGKPAMFVRVNTRAEVRKSLKMLQDLNSQAPAAVIDGVLKVYAPDGDLVFLALPRSQGDCICRYHKEVFAQ